MADRGKLKSLILHIAHELKDAEYFGSTKLNKALYNAEAASYVEFGKPLTGFAYKKNRRGPTLTAYLHVIREMQEDGSVEVVRTGKNGKSEDRVTPLRPADMSGFSDQELKIIRRELDAIHHLTGGQTRDRSHQTAAWFATKLGETIPWNLSLVEDPGNIGPFSPNLHEWANDVIEQHLRRTGRA